MALPTLMALPAPMTALPTLAGVDFTSAPRRAKSIVVAIGRIEADPDPDTDTDTGQPGLVRVDALQSFTDFAGFERWLDAPGPWLGAFDLPFGLPRALMAHWRWCAPTPCATDPSWSQLIGRVADWDRGSYVQALRDFCRDRPVGDKFAHRQTDGPAGSSPSMKWVNPPVALMLREGAPRLARAGVRVPGLAPDGDGQRLAFEGYPGLVARSLIGRQSYKSDDRARQTPERAAWRARLLQALASGRAQLEAAAWQPSDRFEFAAGLAERCLADATGDSLDAVLCLALAAWAWRHRYHGWGLPNAIDPLEGWIIGAPGGRAAPPIQLPSRNEP